MSREARLKFIDRKIKNRGKVTVKDVVEEYEVSTRTVKRDIEYLKYSLDAPIVYSIKLKGYHYIDEFQLFNFAGEKLLIFYALLKKIIKSNNFLPTSSEEIIKLIEEKMEKDYFKLSSRIIYNFSEIEPVDLEDFKDIITSIETKKQVSISYMSGKGKESSRNIEPQLIVNYNGSWYLIAYCHKALSLRTFAFSRIIKFNLTDINFVQNYKEDELQNFFDENFGIYLGNSSVMVKINFYEPIMYTVRKQIWHKDQKVEVGENKIGKYISFTLPVANYEEIIAKTLAYSPYSEIIEPKIVRDKWLEVVEANYQKYFFRENK